jgi:hypothetical protein
MTKPWKEAEKPDIFRQAYVPLEEKVKVAPLSEAETIALNLVKEFKKRKENAIMTDVTFLHKFIDGGDIPYIELMDTNSRLKLKYQVDNPFQIAVEAVKPVIRFLKSGNKKNHLPTVIKPKLQCSIVGRWIVDACYAKTKGQGSKLRYREALFNEIDAIIAGNSSLYAKRYQMHKTP